MSGGCKYRSLSPLTGRHKKLLHILQLDLICHFAAGERGKGKKGKVKVKEEKKRENWRKQPPYEIRLWLCVIGTTSYLGEQIFNVMVPVNGCKRQFSPLQR